MDIVERLRSMEEDPQQYQTDCEAADEIEKLQSQRDELLYRQFTIALDYDSSVSPQTVLRWHKHLGGALVLAKKPQTNGARSPVFHFCSRPFVGGF